MYETKADRSGAQRKLSFDKFQAFNWSKDNFSEIYISLGMTGRFPLYPIIVSW